MCALGPYYVVCSRRMYIVFYECELCVLPGVLRETKNDPKTKLRNTNEGTLAVLGGTPFYRTAIFIIN